MYIIDNHSRCCRRQRGLFNCLCFISSVGATDILLKVSNLNGFFYQVVQILALLCDMSMLLMVGASLLLVSPGWFNLDQIWSSELGQLLN